jgi:ferredoxin
VAVFSGFMVLLLNSLILWGRGYYEPFDFWIFGIHQPLGIAYAFIRDIFTVLVIVGVLVFYYYRLIARLPRLTLNKEGLLILSIIFVMMIADLTYEGVEINAPPNDGRFRAAMPFASLAAVLLRGLSGPTQHALWQAGFWMHSALVLIFLNLLPYGKHFHVITVLPNVFFRSLKPSGWLAPIEDIEGRLERSETLGVKRVHDLSWKGVLDLYTCTECGRCSDQCPANNTGKLLSPKHISIALRDHMYLRAPQLIEQVLPPAPGGDGEQSRAVPGPEAVEGREADIPPPGEPHGVRDRTTAAADECADAVVQTEQLAPATITR